MLVITITGTIQEKCFYLWGGGMVFFSFQTLGEFVFIIVFSYFQRPFLNYALLKKRKISDDLSYYLKDFICKYIPLPPPKTHTDPLLCTPLQPLFVSHRSESFPCFTEYCTKKKGFVYFKQKMWFLSHISIIFLYIQCVR